MGCLRRALSVAWGWAWAKEEAIVGEFLGISGAGRSPEREWKESE